MLKKDFRRRPNIPEILNHCYLRPVSNYSKTTTSVKSSLSPIPTMNGHSSSSSSSPNPQSSSPMPNVNYNKYSDPSLMVDYKEYLKNEIINNPSPPSELPDDKISSSLKLDSDFVDSINTDSNSVISTLSKSEFKEQQEKEGDKEESKKQQFEERGSSENDENESKTFSSLSSSSRSPTPISSPVFPFNLIIILYSFHFFLDLLSCWVRFYRLKGFLQVFQTNVNVCFY